MQLIGATGRGVAVYAKQGGSPRAAAEPWQRELPLAFWQL